MSTENGSKFILFEARWRYLAIIVIVTGIFISVFKLATPYSYGLDELFSINASSGSLASLHQILLNDVHPPLYQLLLKGWIAIFGNSEFSTRSLSWLFAVSAIYPLYRFSHRYGHVFLGCSLVFLCSNMLFAFYANETRAYAMMLFLSAVVMTSFFFHAKDRISYQFLVSCLLLSLTHYFGLIFVGVMLAFCFVENRKNKSNLMKIFSTGLLSLIWPLHHALNGAILNKTSGNFWIKVNGITDSFAIAASGFLPITGRYDAYILICFVVLSIFFGLYARSISANISDNIAATALTVSYITLCFLIVVAVIDLYTPLSTRRNYIVLLPALAIIFSSSVYFLAKILPIAQNGLLIVVCFFGFLALVSSYKEVVTKASAPQDWKNAIRAAVMNAEGRTVYVRTYDGIVEHYLEKYSGKTIKTEKYSVGLTEIRAPAVLVYGHLEKKEYKKMIGEMKAANGKRIFPAFQNDDGYAAGTFLIN